MPENDKHFRAVADALPVMLWAADADQRCTYFNRRWLEFTGRTLEQELSQGWTNGIHPGDVSQCVAAYDRSLKRRREFHTECRLRRADGEYCWVLATGAPQFSGGVFARYVGTCTEIGDVIPAHQGLFHKKLETIGILAGGIAHDFNNLLGSILADADVALAHLPHGSAGVEDVTRLRAVAIRASEIVRELMVYAGQEQGQMTNVDLSSLVEEMLGLLKVSIAKDARLSTDLAGDLPPVRAEAPELRQLVMNLILNASEAIQGTGGEIHIATCRVTIGRDEPGLQLAPGEYVRLDVFDTGRGISRDLQDRIFKPYFTTKKSGGGFGLGVVRRVVQKYGGAIRCDSQAARGAHFAVLLPRASGKKAAIPSTASKATPSPTGPTGSTLLIVEDEESLRVPVAHLLRRRGFRVIEAADGSAAIEALRDDGRVDAVLLDLTLPGITGRDVVAEAARIRPDLKIVLTSAYGQQAAGEALDAPQVKAFIRKPYEVRELTRLLDEVLSPSAEESTSSAGSR